MRVEVAEDGPAALERVRHARETNRRFPLALIDYQMPGMNGLTLAGLLRKECVDQNTRILILSSVERLQDAGALHAAGVNKCLVKPVRQKDLLRTIREVLRPRLHAVPSRNPEASQARERKPLSVLVVEDNKVNQIVITRLLEKEGQAVSIAGDGRQALAAFETGKFDVALMDLQLPDMDGLEVTRRIRALCASKRQAQTPIIALTAHVLVEDRALCLEAGMSGYLTKPVRADALQQEIRKVLASRDCFEDEPVTRVSA
jgi:CheY-like chemotaxis protein